MRKRGTDSSPPGPGWRPVLKSRARQPRAAGPSCRCESTWALPLFSAPSFGEGANARASGTARTPDCKRHARNPLLNPGRARVGPARSSRRQRGRSDRPCAELGTTKSVRSGAQEARGGSPSTGSGAMARRMASSMRARCASVRRRRRANRERGDMPPDPVDVATLPPFSNQGGCPQCGARYEIRVHFDRHCAPVLGDPGP